jgi:hypothetical protein
MKTEIQILEEARAKIADPKNWTKGVLWRDAEGQRVPPKEGPEKAVCFCMLGAIRAVVPGEEHIEERSAAACRLWEAVNSRIVERKWQDHMVIADFNDAPTTTHEMVLAKYDEAIAMARESASVAA